MAVKQSIPDVGSDLDSHTRALKAIKEAVELGQATPREQLNSFLTLARAVDMGLLGQQGELFVRKTQTFFDLALNSPWVSYDASSPFHSVPGYYRDTTGRVFLRGLVASGTGATVIGNLGAGYRPQFRTVFGAIGYNGSMFVNEYAFRVDVDPDGAIRVQNTIGAFAYLSLDGISFAAYQ